MTQKPVLDDVDVDTLITGARQLVRHLTPGQKRRLRGLRADANLSAPVMVHAESMRRILDVIEPDGR